MTHVTRRRQFGSIRKLPSGRWQARYRHPATGETTSGGTFATKADAARWLAAVETDQARGEWVDPSTNKVTVATTASWWLQTVVPARARSDNTIEQYRIIVERHLIPALGAIPVTDLNPEQVDAWLAERDHLAATYLARLRSTLIQILTHSERRGLVSRNVGTMSVLPRGKPPKPRRSLTPAEARALLAAARGERLEAMIVVGMALGLRPGELTGLLWSDIDLESDPPTLRVSGQVKRRPSGEVYRDNQPKRATAARRTLALPAGAARALAEHRDRQGTDVPAGLVFRSAQGGPLDPSNVRREFARIAKAAGLDEGFPYLLRHSGASLMLDAGASIEEVADVLGDNPATLLRHYRHRVRPVADGSLRLAGLFEAPQDGTGDGS